MAGELEGEGARELRFPVVRARRRAERDPDVLRLINLVALEFAVPVGQILHPSRCRAEVARARMVAMYLCHVVLERKLAVVGSLFGRDRTTAAHACAKIEDRRDEADFEAQIVRLEEALLSSTDATRREEIRSAAG